MKKFILKLVNKKDKGQSDLICSLFALTAIIAVLFLSVSIVQDINKVTIVDQAARQGIIKLETQGKPENYQGYLESIKASLVNSGLEFTAQTVDVNGVPVQDGVYVAYKNGSDWVIDTSNNHSFNYNDEVAIYIQCRAATTKFGGNIFGNGEDSLSKNNSTLITRLKASITKAA